MSMGMNFTNRAGAEASGFVGFQTIHELRRTKLAVVPAEPGVYLVLREGVTAPAFLPTSSGGRFKGKDPTVSVETLSAAWVDGVAVMYVGQAGGNGSAATLRKRLAQLLEFGAGRPIGHWGGRYLWQLHGIDDASICWRSCGDADACDIESGLIADFKAQHGKRPFANLRD